jgi:hypothetical protein
MGRKNTTCPARLFHSFFKCPVWIFIKKKVQAQVMCGKGPQTGTELPRNPLIFRILNLDRFLCGIFSLALTLHGFMYLGRQN